MSTTTYSIADEAERFIREYGRASQRELRRRQLAARLERVNEALAVVEACERDPAGTRARLTGERECLLALIGALETA
jgi:hypothetical protein